MIEVEFNNGVSIEERSQDGFCYKYLDAHEVKYIDGFAVELQGSKKVV